MTHILEPFFEAIHTGVCDAQSFFFTEAGKRAVHFFTFTLVISDAFGRPCIPWHKH